MKLKIDELVKKFNLEIINKSKSFSETTISGSHISSGSYEFFGKIDSISHSLICFGSKESKVFKAATKQELDEGFKNLAKVKIPGIIISNTFSALPIIKEYIVKYDLTLLKVEFSKSEVFTIIGTYLMMQLASVKIVHASLVNIYGVGVLIQGKSGIGKSEITLDLVNRGHFFIGDDAIDIIRFATDLYGKSSLILKDNLEVRGIGILNMKKMYGIHKMMDETKIDMVVELTDSKEQDLKQERLGNKTIYELINTINVPKIIINTLTSKNLSQLIEASVINFKLKQDGYDSSEEFIKKISNNLKK